MATANFCSSACFPQPRARNRAYLSLPLESPAARRLAVSRDECFQPQVIAKPSYCKLPATLLNSQKFLLSQPQKEGFIGINFGEYKIKYLQETSSSALAVIFLVMEHLTPIIIKSIF